MPPAKARNDRWSSRARIAFAAFAAIGAFLLIVEHRAHVFPYLPWLLLAACPLMHLFMHGGHGRHGAHHGPAGDNTPDSVDERGTARGRSDGWQPGSASQRPGHRHQGGQ